MSKSKDIQCYHSRTYKSGKTVWVNGYKPTTNPLVEFFSFCITAGIVLGVVLWCVFN